MKLPNAENAEISIEKLRDYILNEAHPRGKHKARVFKSVLGLTKEDAKLLKNIIKSGVTKNEILETVKDEFGIRYIVDIEYSKTDIIAIIRTLWIMKINEDIPKFISCYIKR